jgi:hypothetical protein
MLKRLIEARWKRANGQPAQLIPALKRAGLLTLRESRLKTAVAQEASMPFSKCAISSHGRKLDHVYRRAYY